jgi:anti-sigma regulatory factor (Ser/Thr protein kinase)
MYEREHTIADRLQHAALPKTLPDVPGFDFDGFYEPAGNEAQVGGDWYDAVLLNDGRMVISIGDVVGAGLEAAVTMASMRQAIRAVAQIYADPMTMLDAADRTLKEEQPGRIVTAFVGVVDPIVHTMTYASAGHPPPFMRTAGGDVVELRAQSLPLGLRMRGDGGNAVTEIPPGCMIAFYTDGLSEATRDLFEGEERLRGALQEEAILRSGHPAADIKEAVYDGNPHGDDVAILTMRVTGTAEESGVHRWSLRSDDAPLAAQIRGEFVAALSALGVAREALFTCELIFGELLGNVVRYAPGRTEIVLDTGGSSAVLHFVDDGKGFTLIPRLPTDLLSERGRGLFLIWTLSEDFNVDVRAGGGAHARAVLPVSLASRNGSTRKAPRSRTAAAQRG